MRILLWHGYLLGGTGSNVYTRQLAREWSRAGHEVTVLSQERRPEDYDLGGAATARPDVGGFLPVFVLDRYEGFDDVRRVPDCTREELERWVDANAAAVRALLPADLVYLNHVLLGGPVGAATGAAYAVKAHGSELEYAMRGRRDLGAWGAQSLAGARATFVGSAHIRDVVEEVCGPVMRVHEVPPGVDIELWRPEEREVALAALLDEARKDAPNLGNAEERLPDDGNAARLALFLAGEIPTVVYFGKLIEQKGVHVLLHALQGLDARVVVVGFGPERASLEALAASEGVARSAIRRVRGDDNTNHRIVARRRRAGTDHEAEREKRRQPPSGFRVRGVMFISSTLRPAGHRRASAPVMRIERVREGVPEQVERENRGHDREAGQDDEAGIGVVVAQVLADHLPPRGGGNGIPTPRNDRVASNSTVDAMPSVA